MTPLSLRQISPGYLELGRYTWCCETSQWVWNVYGGGDTREAAIAKARRKVPELVLGQLPLTVTSRREPW